MASDRVELSKPPLNILLNPEELRSKRPWDIDILHLLEIFIRILERMETPDLRLCGSAALSSAMIYRLKVESLFLFEKLMAKRRVIDRTEPPSIIDMPYRYELPATSLDDLVSTLENILEEMMLATQVEKPKLSVIEVEPVLEVDTFSVQIQNAIAELKLKIAGLLRERRDILFSEYVKDMSTLEKVRTLLLLLFIANEGLLNLMQLEEDIMIVGAGAVADSS